MTTRRPCCSKTISTGRGLLSNVIPYCKPLQPPPLTNTRRRVRLAHALFSIMLAQLLGRCRRQRDPLPAWSPGSLLNDFRSLPQSSKMPSDNPPRTTVLRLSTNLAHLPGRSDIVLLQAMAPRLAIGGVGHDAAQGLESPAPGRSGVSKSTSSSRSRQRRSLPSAVSRSRLHPSQNGSVTLLMKPSCPTAPGSR